MDLPDEDGISYDLRLLVLGSTHQHNLLIRVRGGAVRVNFTMVFR